MIVDRTTKIRWRRRYRARKRQVEDIGQQAEDQLEQQFFKRLSKLSHVRRFVAAWVLLLVLLAGGLVAQTLALSHYYQHIAPVNGGTYTEGVLGAFTNASPLFATSAVDTSVAQLVFAGLFKFDSDNHLVGDLAEKWTVDDRGLTYTVTLRPNLQWQDGQALTVNDVLFTYATIQNPDARSPLQPSWRGVKLAAPNAQTVTFTLPSPLTAFPYSLVNGIVPKHLLAAIPMTELRSASFNTSNPIGAGPFKWDTIQVKGDKPTERQEEIVLTANAQYHTGPPKLDRFILRSYRTEKKLLDSFKQQELSAMAGLDSLPDTLQGNPNIQEYSIPLTSEVMVFFRTDSPLLADQKIRQALVQAVNVPAVDKKLGYPVVVANSPLLSSQLGYDKTSVQLGYDPAAANKLLDDAGWIRGKDSVRFKDGKPLSFQLFSQSTSEYALVTQELQAAWRAIGVVLRVNLQTPSDLQGTANSHDYDALLYGIAIGSDPDVFAYWDSAQADNHLSTRFNFSNYKSPVADKALEAGRTRLDPGLRTIKYKPFLDTWRTDAPALALYQPRFLYVTQGTVHNFKPRLMNDATNRYANVTNWMVREAKVAR
ncbi:MAG: peptide-binding protein [Candidatus Saccharimonadales bacterium]